MWGKTVQTSLTPTAYTDQNSGPVAHERRRHKRSKLNRYSTIRLKSGSLVCSCVIKDISKTGARLLVANRTWVPSSFSITGKHGDESYEVQKVWSKGEEIGVRFSSSTLDTDSVYQNMSVRKLAIQG